MQTDGSVVTELGELIHFSPDKFIREICGGKNCFYCSAKPEDTSFNDEHVLPNWILKKFKLHQLQITLPNRRKVKYGSYKIPCCKNCNDNLSQIVEKPIRELLERGYEKLHQTITSQEMGLLYIWLSLIYFKAHYKDAFFRHELEIPFSGPISDKYVWGEFHHIHCIARVPLTNAKVDSACMGTFFILSARCEEYFENFDYCDLYESKTIFLRLGDIALFASLTDATLSFKYLENILKTIEGPLTPIQLREVFAHLSFVSAVLPQRPIFKSLITLNEEHSIYAEIPELSTSLEVSSDHRKYYGKMLHHALKDLITESQTLTKEEVEQKVLEGEMTFLLDENGGFNKASVILK